MKTVIEMAREAKLPEAWISDTGVLKWSDLERFAELVRADEAKRADALAATIAGLRDILTCEAESKAEFIARVRNVLGACPDQRVLHAVMAEREACAKVADGYIGCDPIADAIRARSNT